MTKKITPEAEPMPGSEFRDFPGIILQSDAHDMPNGGGRDQVNVRSDAVGQMAPRDGMLPVSFDYSA